MTGKQIVELAQNLRSGLPLGVHDRWVESIYADSAEISSRNVNQEGKTSRLSWERRLD
jgi:hypothetical protein